MTGTRRDQGRGRRPGAARRATLAVCIVALVVAAAPATATSDDTLDRLDETRTELDGARDGLGRAAAAVEDAQARIAAIDERLAVRTAELARLESELAQAEQTHARTVERLADITAQVRDAGDELRELETAEAEHRDRLTERVAAAYMRGGTAPSAAITILLGVSDLHDVSVGLRAVGAVLEDDRALVERTRELKHETADHRAELALLRGAQQDAEATARDERSRVERLVRREQQVIAQVEEERDERLGILHRLEQDETLQAELVRRLEERLRTLTRELVGDPHGGVTVDWEAIAPDGPLPDWAVGLPERGRIWAPAIDGAARQAGIEPRLLAAVVWSESSFRPGAVSRAGAIGLAQLMPGTAAGLGVDPRDPVQNLAGGATYLARQLAAFGSVDLALAAYNAGPGAVRAHDGIPPFAETQMYVLTVLDRFEQLLRQG